MFGPHLIMDCYGCDAAKLQNVETVYNTLDIFPDRIGMTKIMPPYVFRYRGKVEEEWGVSGVVLIAESHITIHTFPDKGYLTVDLFSCKAFDVDLAISIIQEAFTPVTVEHELLTRGREYPRNLEHTLPIVQRERLVAGEREESGAALASALADG